jgi:hypothetical protein
MMEEEFGFLHIVVTRPEWFLALNREFIPGIIVRGTKGELWLEATLPHGCTLRVPVGMYSVNAYIPLGEGERSTEVNIEVQVPEGQIGVAHVKGFENPQAEKKK